MKPKPKSKIKKLTIDFFGGLGYLTCITQWIWSIILYFEPLKNLSNKLMVIKTVEKIEENITPEVAYNPSSTIISIAITLIIIGLTIYVVTKIPIKLASNSKKIVHETTNKLTPIIIKITHQKKSKKTILKLTPKILIAIKLVVIILPVLLALSSTLLADDQVFDIKISLIVSLFLMSMSFIWFIIQYIMAKIFQISLIEAPASN